MSRTVRVYVPATMDDLAAFAATGELGAVRRAHAVTPAVQADDPDSETDEWEFAAFLDAVAASLGLLAPESPARRVVVSVDVDPSQVSAPVGSGAAAEAGGAGAGGRAGDDHPASVVELTGVIGLAAVAAVHVDGTEAVPAVRAVLAGAPASTLDDVALEWYAPTEVPDLLT